NETSERRKKQYDVGAELIGWTNRLADGASPGIVKRGYGCAAAFWPVWNTACGAEADVHRDGRVEIRSGFQDIGTGTFTLVTDLAASELGIDRSMITVYLGNSKYPQGPGSGGSQVSRSVAPATVKAL